MTQQGKRAIQWLSWAAVRGRPPDHGEAGRCLRRRHADASQDYCTHVRVYEKVHAGSTTLCSVCAMVWEQRATADA